MSTVKRPFQQHLALIFGSILFSAAHVALAVTDFEARESYLKARASNHEQEVEQADHVNHIDKSLDFHGVFYGFLPCSDCNGIKVTLSLKQNNNYLLVTQQAKESSREFYEKGKYTWNDDTQTVVLTPRKGKEASITKQYLIKDEGTLIQLNEDGKQITGDLADHYILRRSDVAKSREVHIH